MAEGSTNVLVKEKHGVKEFIMPRNDYLTPLELFIVGDVVNADDLVSLMDEAKAGNKEALKELLTPIAFNAIGKKEEKQTIIDNANMARKYISKKRKFGGVFKIFDSQKLVNLANAIHSIKPVIKLGPVNKEGQISPEWNITLMNEHGNRVRNTNILPRLIKEKYSRFFSISEQSGDTGTVLKFRLKLAGFDFRTSQN